MQVLRHSGESIRRWVVVFVLACALVAGSGLSAFANPDDDYSLAAGFYKRMRWDLAADGFRDFIAKNPKHEKVATARLYLGLSLINLKDYKGARESLRTFVKEAPQNRNVQHAAYRIGECSYLLDDLQAADKDLGTFVVTYPEDPLLERALPYLADVQLRLNQPEQAAKTFRQAIDKFPQGVMADDSRFGLARAYEALKKYPEAIQLYQELASRPEGDRAAEAQLSLGARYYEDGKFQAAADSYAKLIQQHPKNALVSAAQLNEGYARYQLGDFKAALPLFDAAAKDPKQSVDALYWKGLTLKGLNDLPAAVAVFQQEFEAHGDHPLAPNLLYQWADCEQRLGHYAEARKLFLDLVGRWPKSELADDSLHFAALSAFDAKDAAGAAQLVDRFSKEFPRSGLRWHQEILRGRLALENKQPQAAIASFERVVKESESETTRAWARYYLGFTHRELHQDAEALADTAPIVALLEKQPDGGGLESVYLLRAAAETTLGKQSKNPDEKQKLLASAIESATRYLSHPHRGGDDQAIALRAVAAAHAGLKEPAKRDLQALQQRSPRSPELDRTEYDVAEVAFANEDFDWAGALFGDLASREPDNAYRARGLSGLGWSQYRRQQFPAAAASFGKVVTEYPQAEGAAEAAFMQGRALQDAKQLDEAVKVFVAARDKYTPSRYAYLAGLQAGRLLHELDRIPEADAAYAATAEKFSKADDLDKLLDEWALLNYSHERFERSDEIFRRLVKDFPNSDLADNAALSLAESDLLANKLDAARQQFLALAGSPKSDALVQQAALHQLIGIAVDKQAWKDVRDSSKQLAERFPDGKDRWYAELHWAEADLNLQDPAAARDRLLKVKQQKDVPALRSAPWYAQLWVLLAESQFRLKDYNDVEATEAEFSKWNPQSPLLYLVEEIVGRSLKAQAKFAEARAAFQKVIDDPSGRRTETAAKSQFMIAEMYLLEKDFKTAEQEYLKVDILYKFPEWQAPALLQAASCQEQLNRWADAVKTYQSLIEQYPQTEFATKAKERLPNARKKAAGS
ncbi:MAG TPA: tetratricopeptide repeat protein [Planctomycetaceae bacterium]|nr:tetratricopeptide repeat protein [Planctomycetaceae bacterium]